VTNYNEVVKDIWLKIRLPVISAFIVYHLLALTIWLWPPSLLRTALLPPFYNYIAFFGLWQRWNVFAPDPKNWNQYLTATIVFADHSKKVWEFPRMERFDVLSRMQKERYRKWSHEGVNDFSQSRIWPDTARYIARLNYSAQNPPVMISLTRHWSWIPAPVGGPHREIKDAGGQYTFFTYAVSPQDLQ